MACNSNQRLQCFRENYKHSTFLFKYIRYSISFKIIFIFTKKFIMISKVFSWHFCDIWRCVKYSLHLKLATRLLSICMILWTFDIWYALWVSLLGFFINFSKMMKAVTSFSAHKKIFLIINHPISKTHLVAKIDIQWCNVKNGPNLLWIWFFISLVNPKFHNQVNYLHQKF